MIFLEEACEWCWWETNTLESSRWWCFSSTSAGNWFSQVCLTFLMLCLMAVEQHATQLANIFRISLKIAENWYHVKAKHAKHKILRGFFLLIVEVVYHFLYPRYRMEYFCTVSSTAQKAGFTCEIRQLCGIVPSKLSFLRISSNKWALWCVIVCRCTNCFAPRPTDPFARFCSECGGIIAPLPQSRIPPPAAGQVILASVVDLINLFSDNYQFIAGDRYHVQPW